MGFIENWKNGESAVGRFLAETKVGIITKTAVGPALLWVAQQAGSWDIAPILYVVIAAAVPVTVDMLNPSDTRVGINSRPEEE